MTNLNKTVENLISSPPGGGRVGAVYFLGIGEIGIAGGTHDITTGEVVFYDDVTVIN